MSSHLLYLQVAVVAIVVLLLAMIALIAWNCSIIRLGLRLLTTNTLAMCYHCRKHRMQSIVYNNTSSNRNARFKNNRRKKHFEAEKICESHDDNTEISILNDDLTVMEYNYDI